jgi:hypothetical protein
MIALNVYFNSKDHLQNLVILTDVKGYELYLLRGEQELIEAYKAVIVLEYNAD